MTKNILFTFVLAFIGMTAFGQQGQRMAYVDMNYILENIPAYASAQDQLDKKVLGWQQNLDKIQREISTMKTDLSNEKALLTSDLIAEKNEDIALKEAELQKLEDKYFSSDGNLFLLRKQLVTPIQDQVYNAAQEIAKTRRYDFVFDKSSDLIMLYSSRQHDISELVLKSIVRGEKATKAAANKRSRNSSSTAGSNNLATDTENAEDVTISDRDKKRQEALARIEKQKLDRAKKREDQKKALADKKASRSKTSEVSSDTANKSQASDTKSKDNDEAPTGDQKDDDENEVKISDREAKKQEALARIEKQKLDRAKKREEQKAAIEKKRLERLNQRAKTTNEVKEDDTDSKKEETEKEKEDE